MWYICQQKAQPDCIFVFKYKDQFAEKGGLQCPVIKVYGLQSQLLEETRVLGGIN